MIVTFRFTERDNLDNPIINSLPIRGGYVYGKSDEIGERVAENPVTMPDCNATIAQAMGIDLLHIEHSPSGRPFTVADKGKPVMELFA
jgi:Protein of unknown function (DUF1501)